MNDPAEPRDSASKPAEPDERVRAGFLGFVAHEMRNPLSTALWSAELLVRLSPEERAGARGEKLSGMCLRSLQRLRLLIEDHFLADRLAVSGMPVRIESVSVREALETVLPKAGAPQARIEVPPDVFVSVDRALVERALEGLLAVSARGGVAVTVTTAAVDGAVEVRFRGAPLGPDALRPPEKGTPSDPTGRALALHMADHVARAVGGALSVDGDDLLLRLPAGRSPVRDAP